MEIKGRALSTGLPSMNQINEEEIEKHLNRNTCFFQDHFQMIDYLV